MGGGTGREERLEAWGSGSQVSKKTVLVLLRHLENAGFAGAPRVVGGGFAADGREMLSYIEGSSPHPGPWAEDAVSGVGRLLRDLHAAAATFLPPPGAAWKPWFGQELPGSRPVFGHCDTGPWNIIARLGRPTALVDFEFAGPVDAVWELAQAAWMNAQLHDDDVAAEPLPLGLTSVSAGCSPAVRSAAGRPYRPARAPRLARSPPRTWRASLPAISRE